MLPDIYLLEQFEAVMQERSYTAAAATMNLSRQALTKNIQKIERMVGGYLFTPRAKTLEPTPLALALDNSARPLLSAWDTFSEEMKALSPAHQEPLTISLSHGVTLALGANVAQEFMERNTNSFLSVEETSAEEVAERVLRRESSIGIIGSLPKYLQDFTYMCLRLSGMWFLLHDSHPLAKEKAIYPRQLPGYPVVGSGKRNHQQRFFVEACEKAGVTPTFSMMVTYSATAPSSLPLDEGSLYFSFPPGSFTLPKGWVIRPLILPQGDLFGTYAITSRKTKLSGETQAFWEYLKERFHNP